MIFLLRDIPVNISPSKALGMTRLPLIFTLYTECKYGDRSVVARDELHESESSWA